MRRLALVLGLAVLAACWTGPLPRLAPHSFAVHMTMHMGVVAIASALLALALAGTRADPVRHHPVLLAPVPASAVELVVVWAWHAPVLHHFARSTMIGLALEQGTFLASGVLLWIAALGGTPAQRAARVTSGVLGLLLTSMHMTLLGALLALAPRPLYAHAHGAGGLSALEDQHLGGTIMLLVGGAAYLAGGVGLMAGAMRAPARPTHEGRA
jgi:putative membrane protein